MCASDYIPGTERLQPPGGRRTSWTDLENANAILAVHDRERLFIESRKMRRDARLRPNIGAKRLKIDSTGLHALRREVRLPDHQVVNPIGAGKFAYFFGVLRIVCVKEIKGPFLHNFPEFVCPGV